MSINIHSGRILAPLNQSLDVDKPTNIRETVFNCGHAARVTVNIVFHDWRYWMHTSNIEPRIPLKVT